MNIIKISILMVVKNEESHIFNSINSILQQSERNFELIIIDDNSTDGTLSIIKSFSDPRIKFRHSKKNLGCPKARNISLKMLQGKIAFFTDGDCVLDRDCLKQHLLSHTDSSIVGVNGILYYVSKEYIPSLSDRVVSDEKGTEFMTANISFRSDIIKRIGQFDSRFVYMSDRDFALRALSFGRLVTNNQAIVFHQRKTWTPKQYIQLAKRVQYKVYLYKKHHDKGAIFWRIVYPLNLLIILFPPSLLLILLKKRISRFSELKFIFLIYVKEIYERYVIWKTCNKEKVFLI